MYKGRDGAGIPLEGCILDAGGGCWACVCIVRYGVCGRGDARVGAVKWLGEDGDCVERADCEELDEGYEFDDWYEELDGEKSPVSGILDGRRTSIMEREKAGGATLFAV